MAHFRCDGVEPLPHRIGVDRGRRRNASLVFKSCAIG